MRDLTSKDVVRATDADISCIAALEEKCFSCPYTEESIEDMLAAAIHPSFVLRDSDGALLGYLLGQSIPPDADLLRIAVDPRARRRGVGRALIDAFLSHLKAQGCTVCFLDVREHNIPARTLYLSCGFKPFDRRKNYYRLPSEDAIVMRLPLEEN